MLVACKDGSDTWITLKDMKESNPVDITQFAKYEGIDDEPTFAWWVTYTLRKQGFNIFTIKYR